MSRSQVLATLRSLVGAEVHVSPWFEVTQDRVGAFAAATDDHQWIHVDETRAVAESPWGATIAHGYLTLSLYPALRGLAADGAQLFPGVRSVVNYGINRLRFTGAVRVGARIRLRAILVAVDEVSAGLQVTEGATIEVEGESKPACVAEIVIRLNF